MYLYTIYNPPIIIYTQTAPYLSAGDLVLCVETGRAAGPAPALLVPAPAPAPAPVPAQLPAAAQPLRAKHGHMLVTGDVTRH